ncbi:MAG: type II secretion system protein N, partial [Inhella sp.]
MTPRPRSTRLRIAVALVLGAAAALAWQAPARWLADAVGRHTDQRLMLADSRGSLWFGSALVVLPAGRGGGDAGRLPGRWLWPWGGAGG